MSALRTVKVRIACAVDEDGRWSAFGMAPNVLPNGVDVRNLVHTGQLGNSRRWFWITAELPATQPQEVAGSVEEMGDEH